MCIIKAHNANVDYVVVKHNYFSDNSLSPETPNCDSPILFMCNSLHPQLSPILIGYSLYSIFLLPIHSPPILASNMSPVAPTFFFVVAVLFCFIHLPLSLFSSVFAPSDYVTSGSVPIEYIPLL